MEYGMTRHAALAKGQSASAVQILRHTGSPPLTRPQALLAGHSSVEAAAAGVVQRAVQKRATLPEGAVSWRQSDVLPPQGSRDEQVP